MAALSAQLQALNASLQGNVSVSASQLQQMAAAIAQVESVVWSGSVGLNSPQLVNWTFALTGAVQLWIVPPGVTSVPCRCTAPRAALAPRVRLAPAVPAASCRLCSPRRRATCGR